MTETALESDEANTGAGERLTHEEHSELRRLNYRAKIGELSLPATERFLKLRNRDRRTAITSTIARSLGWLFLFGPVSALVGLGLNRFNYDKPTLFVATCVAGLGFGVLLLGGLFDHMPVWFFKGVMFASTLLVSAVVYAAGAPGSGIRFFYIWVTPYAFVYFSRRQAAIQTAFAAVCVAGVSALQLHEHPEVAGFQKSLAALVALLTTVIVVGMLVRRLTRNLRDVELRFRRGFDHSALGVAFVSLEGTWLDVNDALCTIVGRRREEIIGATFGSLLADENQPITLGSLCATTSSMPVKFEASVRRPRADTVWVAGSAALVTPESGTGYMYLQLWDITENRRSRELLIRQAAHDPLTGMFNRTVFFTRLGAALERRSHEGGEVAVILADLDQFKVVNDSLGHHIGDELLVAIAPRLVAALHPGDTAARLGGDEFVILCSGISGPLDALDRATRMARIFADPLVLPTGPYAMSASIGVALSDGPETTAASLLADADAAMYRAKTQGRNRVDVFDETLRAEATRRLGLERELRPALKEGQFRLEYQPVVNAYTGLPVALEALIRWDHPTRGLVGPGDFIPLAEETGLICDIGEWVLETACAQLSVWQGALPEAEPLVVTVNVSARQLALPDFADMVARVLRETAVARGSLGLEITESVLVAADKDPGEKLRALKALGVRVLLDDFGTGYSSLSYLKRLPIDVVKIDRSFVTGLGVDEEDTAIVDAIIRLAEALHLDVVAEGVETDDQLDRLRVAGCERVQGFLISRPIRQDEVLDWLIQQRDSGNRHLPTPAL